jgi:hypothetical protein
MGIGLLLPDALVLDFTDRESLASGLVGIGEEAVTKSNDALFYDSSTDDSSSLRRAGIRR